MFKDAEELNLMAQAAKKKLSDQKQEAEISDDVDLYAEFRNDEDVVNIDNEYEDIKINSVPTERDYTYEEINGEPSEEEYNYQELNITSNDNPVFDNGPTKSMIDIWKKQWGEGNVFATSIDDDTFIFRTLNRTEYKQIIALQNLDALQREEIICETVTLWPMDYNWHTMATGKAGLPSSYSCIIMKKSGFTEEYSIQVL